MDSLGKTTSGAGFRSLREGIARGADLGLMAVCAHGLILGLAGVYLAVDLAILALLPEARTLEFQTLAKGFVQTTVPFALLGLVFYRTGHVCFVLRPASPLRALAGDLRAFFLSAPRLINALPVIAALFLFMRAYTEIKVNIPLIVPFSWDETFMVWDRAVHLGRHPWEWLQPLIGHPWMSSALGTAYSLWFLVMLTVWAWAAFQTSFATERTQFLVSFMLTWAIGGSLLAIVFSSAGPCFYSDLGLAPDPYRPLMAYIAGIDTSLGGHIYDLQRIVWRAYASGDQQVIAGISAMPSMHNATTLLFAMAAWRASRAAGAVLYVFAFLVLLASVHLGWHYAIDAYAGYAVALAAWWAAGRLACWYHGLAPCRAYAAALAASRPSP